MDDQPARLASGGRIDREHRRTFTFDGRVYTGCAGDTLASALLANRVHLAGRSFKLHRPRGIYSAGVEEPNALVTLRGGGRHEPNIQATMTELWDGLEARSQNRWPSLAFDAMAINGAFARFMPAGFYYKTFMGPLRKSWMWYEPAIRRAAGLGHPTTEPDPDRYERRHAFCEVLEIGAGPAGIAAALAAGRGGARVVLLEQDAVAGGQLLGEAVESDAESWRRARLAELEALPNVQLMTRTTAYGLYDGNVVGALERAWDHVAAPPEGQPRQRGWIFHAGRIVIAAGATERPMLFGNNDRPGVMLAHAARSYLQHYGVLAGRRVVVTTNNDSGYGPARDLRAAGAEVTVLDTRDRPGIRAAEIIAAEGLAVLTGGRIESVHGRRRVRDVRVAYKGGEARIIDCELVCSAGGWTPNVHLSSHRGHRPKYRTDVSAFVPGDLPASQQVAGAITGEFDTDEVIADGWRAGCESIGAPVDPPPFETPAMRAVTGQVAHADQPRARPHAGGRVFVDLQNDVMDKDVELAWREGYRSVEHLKRYTTLGMGTDQGRTSNINGLTLMAGLRGEGVLATGTTTFRPPYTPVSFGSLAGRRTGAHFRPERRTPMHDWHLEQGAQFVRAGAWMRPWYYPVHGRDVGTAYLAEMRVVREGVGIADVSSLGKIDLQGPDAAEFLNRVYVNAWLKLPVGRARYGVMLRDDGFVLDDGTTSRVGENRYFMTTTTAEAGPVMSWLEYLLETAWPDLRVQVTSVSDQWGGVAVAGPKSRHVLEAALAGVDVADETLPPMGVMDAECSDGLPVRVLRVSFSGERAYEVYTPAGHAMDLLQRILEAGRPHGLEPYGLEALAALRIEKGHPAGPELDGRTTLDDLGLGRMARTNKPFVGDVLRQRPAVATTDRRTMVGLEPENTDESLRAGALLFGERDQLHGHGIGHVTSVTHSPTLGRDIALALVERGPEREGETLVMWSPVHEQKTRVRVVSPMFLDPEGERIHA